MRDTFSAKGTKMASDLRQQWRAPGSWDHDYAILIISVVLLLAVAALSLAFPQALEAGVYKTAALAFLAGVILASAASFVVRQVRRRANEQAENNFEPVVTRLQEAVSRFREMKEFHDAGLVGVYPNRITAMQNFRDEIELEDKHIDFVGTSLLGAIDPIDEDDSKGKFSALLLGKRKLGVKIRALLMHPDYGKFRELVEGRASGAVGADITKALNFLLDDEAATHSIIGDRSNLRLYPGVITAFAVFTRRAALINLGTLHGPAYDNCTLIFRDTEDPNSIYKHFREKHFSRPWASEKTVRIDQYLTANGSSEKITPILGKPVDDDLKRGQLQ
jgi:hypothetical protein